MYLLEAIRNGKRITSGSYALALQVWAMSNLDIQDDIIVFPYICDAHVQIGLFQNPVAEVNLDYVKENKMLIVRRDTGGGAIFIDQNSANFCFLIPNLHPFSSVLNNYPKFYEPIIQILKTMGLKNVEATGKNDLSVDQKKVSGAAMKQTDKYIYAGYSLLYDIDFEGGMTKALNPNKKKIESKGIKSVRQRVAKIKDYLDSEYQNLNIYEFKDLIIKNFEKNSIFGPIKTLRLTNEQWAQVDELVKNKYENWDWTFGQSPEYEFYRDQRFDIGTLGISLEFTNAKISKAKITGDFFPIKNIKFIEEALIGAKLEYEDLLTRLESIKIETFFIKKLTAKELVDLIMS
ncbi:lipoate--protein ligase [Mycoplasma sp. 1654_15]|uniref:lipoate--protein ligase n=1 Tax=Mycoplasma sp. 1654_15 TaxID=2725994 RepID=UPI001449FACC|nr:lipoate--protein ligase [Mycoplasma sp. 1654_15]QJB71313.1 lipoate--protein ligase [Mycoplasma sp. 1654_15]